MGERVGYSEEELEQMRSIAAMKEDISHLVKTLDEIKDTLKDYPIIRDKVEQHDKWIKGSIAFSFLALLAVVGKSILKAIGLNF
jgi:hypothetical protein